MKKEKTELLAEVARLKELNNILEIESSQLRRQKDDLIDEKIMDKLYPVQSSVQTPGQIIEDAAIAYTGGYTAKTHDAYMGFVNGAKWMAEQHNKPDDK